MDLDGLLKRFLDYLRASQNASPYTLKNYGNDIGQFLSYCNERGLSALENINRAFMRGYLAELDAAGYVRESVSPAESRSCIPSAISCFVTKSLTGMSFGLSVHLVRPTGFRNISQ